MATPESLVNAFAKGMVEALLATGEKLKKEKPVVAKTADIDAAVRTYLDQLAAQDQTPAQPDLFTQPGIDLGDAIFDRVQEARSRAEAHNHDEPEPGTYQPDAAQGAPPWQSPIP